MRRVDVLRQLRQLGGGSLHSAMHDAVVVRLVPLRFERRELGCVGWRWLCSFCRSLTSLTSSHASYDARGRTASARPLLDVHRRRRGLQRDGAA